MKVTNKTLFPTFARTSLGPPEKISKSVVSLLKAYQWRKFVIVADSRQWTKEITLAIKVGVVEANVLTLISNLIHRT